MSYTTLTELYGLLYTELFGNPRKAAKLKAIFEELEPLWETVEQFRKANEVKTDDDVRALIGTDVSTKLRGIDIQTIDFAEKGVKIKETPAEDYFYARGNRFMIYAPGETTYLTRDQVMNILGQGNASFLRSTKSAKLEFRDRKTGEPITSTRFIELDRAYADSIMKKGKAGAGEYPVIMNFSPSTSYYIQGVKDPKYKCIILDTNKDGLACDITLSAKRPSMAASIRKMGG